MPTARIITRFPDRAGSLRKTLVHAGYRVEVIPPEKAGKGYADLEYDLDSMPEFAAQTASARNPVPTPIQNESKPAHDSKRRSSLRPRIHALTELFARQRQQLERRLSSVRKAALDRKRAWEAETAKRAQDREQKRAEEQLRREQELAAKRDVERIAAERAREQAAIALREKQEREAQLRAEAEAAAQRRVAELAAKRDAERIAAERAREQAAIALREKQEREAQRRAEAEAAAQRRAAELAARREAERIAAEQAAIARREHQEREAERQRLLNAEMERRREREEELARRAAAELRAQISAEKHAQQAGIVTTAEPADNSAIAPPQRRRSLPDRWDDLTFRVYERIREWRKLLPNSEFGNTRDYAWRQAVPAAAGLAIAFVLGWGLALSSTRNETTLQASPAPAAIPAAGPTGVTPTPVASPVRPLRAKPSPSVRKSAPKVYRRHTREIQPKEDDVIIVRHAPKRQLIARASQKNGVKTISDLE